MLALGQIEPPGEVAGIILPGVSPSPSCSFIICTIYKIALVGQMEHHFSAQGKNMSEGMKNIFFLSAALCDCHEAFWITSLAPVEGEGAVTFPSQFCCRSQDRNGRLDYFEHSHHG